jgi:hypothetical protein
MLKASIWRAALIVVVKFQHRSRDNPSVFARSWRSVGMQPNHAIDSDTWQAPLALARARHCER